MSVFAPTGMLLWSSTDDVRMLCGSLAPGSTVPMTQLPFQERFRSFGFTSSSAEIEPTWRSHPAERVGSVRSLLWTRTTPDRSPSGSPVASKVTLRSEYAPAETVPLAGATESHPDARVNRMRRLFFT